MWSRKICARKTGRVSDESANVPGAESCWRGVRQEGSKQEAFQNSRWEPVPAAHAARGSVGRTGHRRVPRPRPAWPHPASPPPPPLRPGCRRGLHGAPRRTGARGPPRAGAPRHARTRGPTGAISPRRPPAPAHVAGDEALRPALCRRSARPTDPPAAPHPEPWGRAAPGSPQQHRAGMLAAPPRSLSPPLLSPRQRPHVSH